MTLGGIFSVETAAQAAFWVVVGLTLAGAVIAVFPRNILYNVLGLVLALTGVAGLYLFLNSIFVALMQLLIYVGAICIAIVFAIMLSRPLHLEAPKRNLGKVAGAAVAAACCSSRRIWRWCSRPAGRQRRRGVETGPSRPSATCC